MQPKKLDELKHQRLLKEELKQPIPEPRDDASDGEGLSGAGSATALAHLREQESKRADKPD